MKTIAWLGAGLLGSGFVESLLARGEAVAVWNRTLAKATPLAEKGARVVPTIAEAVKGADRVHLCLSDDASVDAVLPEVLAALAAGTPIVDHTTVSPAGARERAAKLAALGVGFLACPVFMAPAGARTASGRMLCAGPSALADALAADLGAMTGDLVRLGEDAGRAAATKLVGNTLIIGVTAVFADALTVGVAAGLDASEVHAFALGFPLGGTIQGRGAKMAKGDFSASFELTMARKDVRLMVDASKGRPLATLPSLASRMDALVEAGHGASDVGVLAVDIAIAEASR